MNRLYLLNIIIVVTILLAAGSESSLGNISRSDADMFKGPLTVHLSNTRYFTDGSGKAIYLTGSHTWANLQDRGRFDPPPTFDFTAYLDSMEKHNHNFMRMWMWENAKWIPFTADDYWFNPLPYKRTGPGTALDGKPRFDLTKFNQAYFDRLRSRVIAAGERGIYVSVMLFQGFSVEKKQGKGNPWHGHPYQRDNNINGINGDTNGDEYGEETHTLDIPAITALQRAYVKKVIDTLNDLDNVLWEISNESHPESIAWQYDMIKFIKDYEANKLKQHLVGMTGGPITNNPLFNSPADWISPISSGGYKDNPPAAVGMKVIISDTDHLWGVGGNHKWVWKSFLRGYNPIFMDPYLERERHYHPTKAELWELIRRNMGYTRTYANKVNLTAMVPRGDLASSEYCLANPGDEYLVYLPSDSKSRLHRFLKYIGVNETVTVDLSAASGTLKVEWFNPRTGETRDGGMSNGGTKQSFKTPFSGDAILYIYKPR